MLKTKIVEYEAAKAKVVELYKQLRDESDGYKYVCNLRSFGSNTLYRYTNSFLVQELCDEYNGDNGIVDVYTTNHEYNITTFGNVILVSEEVIETFTTIWAITAYFNREKEELTSP